MQLPQPLDDLGLLRRKVRLLRGIASQIDEKILDHFPFHVSRPRVP